jgi:hypothetical protein
VTAVELLEPGLYDLPEAEYHALPHLSSTGIRRLLPPSCPAKFKHWRDNGDPPKREWEEGSAAHKMVLGAGPDLVRIEGDGKGGPDAWTTNAVKAKVEAARDAGAIPLRPSAFDAVHAMADALERDPVGGPFFRSGCGRPEQTLIWSERAEWFDADGNGHVTEVPCRALVDWLPDAVTTRGRMVLPDYKSCDAASLDATEKSMARFGYYIQLRWYLRGLKALALADDRAEGVLVFQEKTEPYLVTVRQPDAEACRLADIRIREALDTYAECVATDRWPGYADDVVIASLPPWETRELKGDIW